MKPLLPLQPLDLIPQLGGFFKFKIRRRFAHLLFEIRDDGLDVAAIKGGRVLAGRQAFSILRALAAALGGLLHHAFEHVGNAAHDGGRGDAVFEIVGDLLVAAALGLVHRPLHRAGDAVGIEDNLGLAVARRATDRLDQAGL